MRLCFISLQNDKNPTDQYKDKPRAFYKRQMSYTVSISTRIREKEHHKKVNSACMHKAGKLSMRNACILYCDRSTQRDMHIFVLDNEQQCMHMKTEELTVGNNLIKWSTIACDRSRLE